MKTINILILTLVMSLMSFVEVSAQQRRGNSELRLERNKEKLTEELSLTEEQSAKLEALQAERMEKMTVARQQSEAQRKAMRDERMEIQAAYEQDLLAILDNEQEARYLAMKEERKADMKSRRGNRKGDDHSKRGRNRNRSNRNR